MRGLFSILDFLVDHWDTIIWLFPGVALLTGIVSGWWALYHSLDPVEAIALTLVVVAALMVIFNTLPPLLEKHGQRPFAISVTRVVTGKGEDLGDVVIDVSIINRSSRNRVVLELAPCFRSDDGTERWPQPIDLKAINLGLGTQEHTQGVISFHMGPFADFVPTDPNTLYIYESGENHPPESKSIKYRAARGIYLYVVDRISERRAHFRIPGDYPPDSFTS